MRARGFYVVKDDFFIDMADPNLKWNKKGGRPHYYCFKDDRAELFWLIPLSSRVDKYKKIIENRHKQGKACDTLHIAKLDNGKWSVFLIQDMFPVSPNYIEREYTFAGQPLVLTSDRTAEEIKRKANKIMAMLKRGFKLLPTQADVMRILEKLTKQ